jgi:hypothetical protein
MIADIVVSDRILAIFLNQDDLVQVGIAELIYRRAFGDNDEGRKEFRRVFFQLTKRDVLIEYDSEFEFADTLLVEHSEHGQLANSDLSYIGFEDLAAIGPGFVAAVRERSSEIFEQAVDAGFDHALERLRDLPIESWKWTGLSEGFVFDDTVKSKVIKLLRSADDELGSLELTNHETSQARALIKAALILADAPRPEADLVWEIIQRISAIIGIVSGIQGLSSIFKPVK